jgi:dipeptidase
LGHTVKRIYAKSIGGLLWGGLGVAWACGHVPWYVGIITTPEAYKKGINDNRGQGAYDGGSAFWAFETVTNLVNLFYTSTIDLVKPVWMEWEEKLYRLQPTIEKTALELYRKDQDLAVEFLTNYSNLKGTEAFEIARKMIVKLLTVIARKNTGL